MRSSETSSLLAWMCLEPMVNRFIAAVSISRTARIAFFLDNNGQHFLISPKINAKD